MSVNSRLYSKILKQGLSGRRHTPSQQSHAAQSRHEPATLEQKSVLDQKLKDQQPGVNSTFDNRPTERVYRNEIQSHSVGTNQTRQSLPEPDVRTKMKRSGHSIHSSQTAKKVPKPEHHRKTMFKVLDPNVHQMSIGRAKTNMSDEEFVEQISQQTVLSKGVEPKIEFMRPKANRIVVGPTRGGEVGQLRQKVISQNEEIEQLKKSQALLQKLHQGDIDLKLEAKTKPAVLRQQTTVPVQESSQIKVEMMDTAEDRKPRNSQLQSESELEDDYKSGVKKRGLAAKWDNKDAHSYYDSIVRGRGRPQHDVITEANSEFKRMPKQAGSKLKKDKKKQLRSQTHLSRSPQIPMPLGQPRKGNYLPGGGSSVRPVQPLQSHGTSPLSALQSRNIMNGGVIQHPSGLSGGSGVVAFNNHMQPVVLLEHLQQEPNFQQNRAHEYSKMLQQIPVSGVMGQGIPGQAQPMMTIAQANAMAMNVGQMPMIPDPQMVASPTQYLSPSKINPKLNRKQRESQESAQFYSEIENDEDQKHLHALQQLGYEDVLGHYKNSSARQLKKQKGILHPSVYSSNPNFATIQANLRKPGQHAKKTNGYLPQHLQTLDQAALNPQFESQQHLMTLDSAAMALNHINLLNNSTSAPNLIGLEQVSAIQMPHQNYDSTPELTTNGPKSKYSELLQRKNMRNQQIVINQQKILQNQQMLLHQIQSKEQASLQYGDYGDPNQSIERDLAVDLKRGSITPARKRSLNPKNKNSYLQRNQSTNLFDNDSKPMIGEHISDGEKPRPHMPRYQSMEMKRMSKHRKSVPSGQGLAFNGHPVYFKDNQGHQQQPLSHDRSKPKKGNAKQVKLPIIKGQNAFYER